LKDEVVVLDVSVVAGRDWVAAEETDSELVVGSDVVLPVADVLVEDDAVILLPVVSALSVS
jgi:hypothetical protein